MPTCLKNRLRVCQFNVRDPWKREKHTNLILTFCCHNLVFEKKTLHLFEDLFVERIAQVGGELNVVKRNITRVSDRTIAKLFPDFFGVLRVMKKQIHKDHLSMALAV